jgi:hypothetical protein
MRESLTSNEVRREIAPDCGPAGIPLLSRYLRVDQTVRSYPFKKSKLYLLLSSGEIKSFVLKERNARRGMRLIDRFSLDEYLAKKAREFEAVNE